MANDGSRNDLAVAPSTFAVFVEEKSAQWAETQGVQTEHQPHLVIGYPDDMRSIVKGDLLVWGDKTLVAENRPTLYDFGDGFPSAELIATDQKTGGRR